MRLFVAVDVDEATRAALARARAVMQAVLDRARVPPRVTWVRESAAHVTVRFIGEAAVDTVPAIQHALDSVILKPFTVEWGRVGTFGGTRQPRVIWIAPSAGAAAFRDLAEHVNAALDPLLGPGERRPFTPHLTLGRVRDAGRQVAWAEALAAVTWTPTLTQVARVVLYRSQLSPKGSTYTAVSSHG